MRRRPLTSEVHRPATPRHPPQPTQPERSKSAELCTYTVRAGLPSDTAVFQGFTARVGRAAQSLGQHSAVAHTVDYGSADTKAGMMVLAETRLGEKDSVVAALSTRQISSPHGPVTVLGPLVCSESVSPMVGRLLLHQAIARAVRSADARGGVVALSQSRTAGYRQPAGSLKPYRRTPSGGATAAGRGTLEIDWHADSERREAAAQMHVVAALNQALARLARTHGCRDPSEHRSTGLMALGFTSLMLVQAARSVLSSSGAAAPSTLLFDFPTLDAAEAHLLRHQSAPVGAAINSHSPCQMQIGVQSTSCVLPAQVESQTQVWSRLSTAVSGIGPVPADRWAIDEWYQRAPGTTGKMYSRSGGFISRDAVTGFASQIFAISASEAAAMSPSQRLLLERSAEVSVSSLGSPLSAVSGLPIGVCVGSCHHDWERLNVASTSARSSTYRTTGEATSVLAG